MADSIQPSGNKATQGANSEIELKPFNTGAKKTTSPKELSTTSHATDREQTISIDGYNPIIIKPEHQTTTEVQQIQSSLQKKFEEPVTLNEITKIVSEFSSDVKQRVNDAMQKIDKVTKSEGSFAQKTMEIQILLFSTMNINFEIGGEYAKFISDKQTQERIKDSELTIQALMQQAKNSDLSKATKFFGWLGDAFNILFASVALVSAALTGGAPLVIAAGLWLAGAIMGVVTKACDEAGLLKGSSLEKLGVALTWIGIIISLGGQIATGGIAASIKTLPEAFLKIQNVVKAFEMGTTGLRLIQAPTTQIIGAVYQKETARIASEQAISEKDQSNFEYLFDKVLDTIRKMQESINDMLKDVGSIVQSESRTQASFNKI